LQLHASVLKTCEKDSKDPLPPLPLPPLTDTQTKLLCVAQEDGIQLLVAKKVDIFSKDMWNTNANVQANGAGLATMQENKQNMRDCVQEVTFGWFIEW
jgi:hypothetical protein